MNHLSALAGQLTQIIEEKSNPEITKIVTGIVQDSYQLADFYKIEMDSAFENLYHESLIFIMRHSLPERIMVDLEEQYTEEQKYVELDSELVEFFIEKPKNIEVKDREPLPFLLVRPSAISRIEEIKQFLANKNIKVVVEGQINHFEELARRLYPVNPHDSNSYLWFILTRKEFPEKYDQGYVFFLDPSYIDSYEKVFETKLLLKQQLKNNRYLVEFEGQTRETDLHHIHSADSSNLKHESSLIRHYLELSK